MASVHIKTYGCSNNVYESEVMAGILQKHGHVAAFRPESAEIILLNLCTVKGDAQALQHVREAFSLYPQKKLIAAGCVTKELKQQLLKQFPAVSLLNTHTLQKINAVADSAIVGKRSVVQGKDQGTKLLLPHIRSHPLISILPISSGCTNYCSFCSVKLIKGNVFSYPVEQIVTEVERNVADGVKEIYLTSQDTAAYGADTGVGLLAVLQAVLAVEGNFMLRLGMGNPNHFIRFVDELIAVFKHPKMYKFLHIPLQSGSNRVLSSMKREYAVDEYKYIIRKFKEAIPEITIATDIICGYPTETSDEFLETLHVVEETKPNIVNISRYKKRDNTPAALLEQISAAVKHERCRLLEASFKHVAYHENLSWIGWEGNIIINEAGRFRTLKGRNYCYKQMIIQGTLDDHPLGSIVHVKVVDVSAFDLFCEILEKKIELKVVN